VAIAREELLAKLLTVQKYYRVCDVHFDEQSKFPDNRNRTNLKVGSVPRFHVPGKYNFNMFDNSLLDVEVASSEIEDVPGKYAIFFRISDCAKNVVGYSKCDNRISIRL
jgi:hypothetical protein